MCNVFQNELMPHVYMHRQMRKKKKNTQFSGMHMTWPKICLHSPVMSYLPTSHGRMVAKMNVMWWCENQCRLSEFIDRFILVITILPKSGMNKKNLLIAGFISNNKRHPNFLLYFRIRQKLFETIQYCYRIGLLRFHYRGSKNDPYFTGILYVLSICPVFTRSGHIFGKQIDLT